ncbi:MAG: sulfite exporter TauE/SafE family protein [Candidatus Bathyarchaeota archaeon]|nr:sulfite exporter TauE/SafE family protein [Candidatus Bathyarchaeota archaeon]MDH5787419.1 sulfite exporter TauE/SafE family protein [Candidatus Bathyarchaeota archaeon]
MDLWLLIVFGFFIGIIASMAGVGGGIFIVPLLTLFYGFIVKSATATSLTTIIFTAVASAINYARQKRIYYKTGLILVITTAPGAYVGAWLATITEERTLGLVFGGFLVLVAARMIIDVLRTKTQSKNTATTTDSELIKSRKTIIIGIGLSFFGGVASGLLGIGGGTLIVPIMAVALGMPIHYATATSMFTMIFTSISGVARYYQSELIDFPVALILAVGTIFGAQVGAHTSKKVSGKNLSLIFSIILTFAGINMVIKHW